MCKVVGKSRHTKTCGKKKGILDLENRVPLLLLGISAKTSGKEEVVLACCNTIWERQDLLRLRGARQAIQIQTGQWAGSGWESGIDLQKEKKKNLIGWGVTN